MRERIRTGLVGPTRLSDLRDDGGSGGGNNPDGPGRRSDPADGKTEAERTMGLHELREHRVEKNQSSESFRGNHGSGLWSLRNDDGMGDPRTEVVDEGTPFGGGCFRRDGIPDLLPDEGGDKERGPAGTMGFPVRCSENNRKTEALIPLSPP